MVYSLYLTHRTVLIHVGQLVVGSSVYRLLTQTADFLVQLTQLLRQNIQQEVQLILYSKTYLLLEMHRLFVTLYLIEGQFVLFVLMLDRLVGGIHLHNHSYLRKRVVHLLLV